MVYDRKRIVFSGDNEQIFERIGVTDLDVDAQVIVPSTHNAILIKDGRMMDTLGAGAHPIFDVRDGKKVGSVHVEVIYLSRTAKLRTFWGTQNKFVLRDKATDIAFHVGARGEYEVRIRDPRKAYLELIGAEKSYSVERLHDRMLVRILEKVEPAVMRTVEEMGLSYDKFSAHRGEIAKKVYPEIFEMFDKDYGLEMTSFTIEDIRIDEEDRRRIENERVRRDELQRADVDRADREEREKQAHAMEIAERERREDREWEREKFRLELEARKDERYMEVTREIGWESKGNAAFCKNCGAPLQTGTKFCGNCGQPTSPVKPVCPRCGKENPVGTKFCGECGTPL